MSLTLVNPLPHPPVGVSGVDVRPITEGEKMTVIQNQDDSQGSGFWGFLDDVGTTIGNGLNQLATLAVAQELNEFVAGSETAITSQGDPSDQPGGEAIKTGSDINAPFYKKYQTELMIGGVLVVGALLYFATRSK